MNSQETISVLIADDHTMVLEMIQYAVAGSSDIQLTTAADVAGVLSLIEQNGPYDIVLLDVDMPGMNGLEGLEQVQAKNGDRVGIITGDASPNIVQAARRLGAAGIVSKKASMRSLSNAIRFMAAGERYFPLELIMESEANKPSSAVALTDREYSVLRKLADGLANREIAVALSLSEPTIKMHVKSIYKKLGVSSRTQAVIATRDLKLL